MSLKDNMKRKKRGTKKEEREGGRKEGKREIKRQKGGREVGTCKEHFVYK